MALTRIKVLDANSNININSANIATTLTVSGNLVAGNVTTTSSGGSVNVPKISSIAVTNSSFVANGWQAVSNTGGYIVVNGSGFVSGAVVLVGTKTASATTFANSNALLVQVPAQVDGTYPVYVTNPDGGVAISVPGLTYNDLPVWSTGSTLPGGVVNSPISIQLSATDTTTVTYSVASGSTLPPGLTLSSSGLLSGTVTGISGLTVYTFAVNAVDTYSQNTTQTFSITIQISDPYFNYTSLLLSASTNSANTTGSSNANTVIDSSYNYNNITRVGNPGQGTFTPFGTNWSNSFTTPASGNQYIQYAYGSTSFLSSTAKTIEGWFFLTSLPSGNGITTAYPLLCTSISSSNIGNGHYYGIGASAFVFIDNRSVSYLTISFTVPVGQWFHLAFVTSNGNNYTLYINGSSVGTVTDATSWFNDSTDNLYLAAGVGNGGSAGGYSGFGGYMSNIRITSNAVYSSNFTPSTSPLTAISGTTLLTAQSNRFIDNSSLASPVTVLNSTGPVSVQRFNPFGANSIPYATSSNTYIGSTYFNGTTDYLVLATGAGQILSTTTQNFTVECWVNPLSTSGSTLFWLNGTGGTFAYAGLRLDWNNGSNQIRLLSSQTGSAWDTSVSGPATPPSNTWYHVAVTRNGNTANVYLNGILGITTTIGSIYGGTQNQLAQLPNPYWWGGYISNFRVINGVALYTSNFIPPTAPLSVVTNTSILCCQSSQSVTYDANTTPNSITAGGTPRPTKSVPFSQSWAGQFNGSTSYLSIPYNSAFNFSTNNLTIECWFYCNLSATQTLYAFNYNQANNGQAAVRFAITGSSLYMLLSTDGSTWLNSGAFGSYNLNTWNHAAIVRNGSTFTLYINGVAQGTQTTSSALYNASGNFSYIGQSYTVGQFFNGYISNLRVVNGTALYTSNFTPTNTPLTAIANTALLTLQSGSTSNTFIDNSTNGFTITANGTPSANVVSMAAPGYSPMPIVDSSSAATIYSGSYYFATNDYLTYPEAAIGTNTFTYEFWAYPTAAGNNTYYKFAGGNSFQIGYNSTTFSAAATTGSWAIAASTNPQLNAWNHIALVRTGTGTNQFFLYLNGVLVGTSTSSTTYAAQSGYIGGGPAVNTQVGYISNPRLIIGQALYTSNFTPPTAPLLPTANIAYSGPSNTALLLSGTNVGAYDSTMINDFINVGGVSVNSNVKQYGTNSYYFNGSSYLQAPASPNLTLGSGDFTIEVWVYTTIANQTYGSGIIGTYDGATNGGWDLSINRSSGGPYGIMFSHANALQQTYNTYLSTNTWYHIAVTRSSGTLRTFLNGTQVATGTYATADTVLAPCVIGSTTTAAVYHSGYIQDARITKGVARYTANFTVPSTPFITQ